MLQDVGQAPATQAQSTPIEVLQLPIRARNALKRNKIYTVEQLVDIGEEAILDIKQVGSATVSEVFDSLATFLSLSRDDLAKFGSTSIAIGKVGSESVEENLLQFSEYSISVLRLSNRARNLLAGADIQTIGQLLEIRSKNGLGKIKRMGKKSRLEIENALSWLQSEAESILASLVEVEVLDTRPYFVSLENNSIPNLVRLIYPFTKSLFEAIGLDRDLDILRRRFGLDGSDIYTLQDIGYYYELTRERVRQIESRSITRAHNVLFGEVQLDNWRVQDELIVEASAVQKLLFEKDDLLTEYEIFDEFESRYDTTFSNKDVVYLRLLLEVFGFNPLPKSIADIDRDVNPAWIAKEGINIAKLRIAVKAVFAILQESSAPTTLFDLKINLNKQRKKAIETKYIYYAVRILQSVERISESSFQIKFEYLSSIADKVFRIIFEAGKPLHINDIWREINHRLAKSGLATDASARSITNQLIADSRFKPTGRSGIWSLSEWEHIRRETIVELMIEFFHLRQKSATTDEVYEYVYSKRQDISKNSVVIYLQARENFVRISQDEYELSAWGSKSFEGKKRISVEEAERSTINELDAIFAKMQEKVMPLGELVRELMKRTNLSDGSVYRRLKSVPQLKLEPDPNYGRRKLARYVDDSKVQIQPPLRITKREIIQLEIENYLKQEATEEALVSEVAKHIQKSLSSPRATFYRYLSEMSSVKKKKIDGELYCFLVHKTTSVSKLLVFLQVDQIQDSDLKVLLESAIRLLNIDNVDLGLFQLGRIFENELRTFLVAAKDKGSLSIVKRDMNRLVDMIDCVERNKIIDKKHHLTLLREQRNARAHGTIPDLAEREKLMQHAPFLGDLYIEYIVYFRERRKKL